MTVQVGDEAELDGVTYVICGITAQSIALREMGSGITREILSNDFVRAANILGRSPTRLNADPAELAALQYLPETTRAEVWFLAGHLRELLASLDQKDQSATSAEALTRAKQQQLAEAGYNISARTLRRKIKTFRERGAAGLVDGRKIQESGTHRRTDPRVIAALAEVMANQTKKSTGTRSRLVELTAQLLDERHGAGVVPIPSNTTTFRLIADLDRGRLTTGSAKTRRSLANRPDRAFSPMGVSRPGEQVQIDSTSLDVLIQLDGGLTDRPDLTIMLDVATRSIISAVLRPGATKSVDLIVALARALVPYDMRPGGRTETRALMEAAFDDGSLMPDENLDAYRRQQPYIFPERITTDRGKIYVSDHFENACEQLRISLNVSASYTPTDKAKVERTFQSINTGFTQYLKNYTGRGVEYRGVDVEPATLHSLVELQELLDEWIAVVWQNRPHDSLRDPLHPAVSLSPNEMFRAYQQLAPAIQIPFDVNTYISLLPVKWRTIQAYGITIDHRTYDSPGLNEYRRTKSPHPGHDNKWPIHTDPYNLQTVWIPIGDEWLPLEWSYATATGPMSADVWAVTHRPGFFANRPALEKDIAARSRDILTRAGAGRSRANIAAARSRTVGADPMRLTTHTPELATDLAIDDETDETDATDEIPTIGPRLRFKVLNIQEEVQRKP
jgi:putative transposase